MSESVSVHAAKTHLSRLLQKVELGESIVITRGGKPGARLEALSVAPRRPGSLKGRIRIARILPGWRYADVSSARDGR